MQVVLTVKNTSKVLKPTKDNVLLYDGHMWYVTTKADLLKETNDLLKECQETLEALKQQNLDFKAEVASQVKQMSDAILQIIALKEQEGDKL